MKIVMKKRIFFVIDSFDLIKFRIHSSEIKCYSYEDTCEAIENNMPVILTYSIANMNFNLNDLGYDIYIVYKGKFHLITPNMKLPGGQIVPQQCDLCSWCISGIFDELIEKKSNPKIMTPNEVFDNEKLIRDLENRIAKYDIGDYLMYGDIDWSKNIDL